MKEVENICSSSYYKQKSIDQECVSELLDSVEVLLVIRDHSHSGRAWRVSYIIFSNSFCHPGRSRKKQIFESLRGWGLVRCVLLMVIGEEIKDIPKNVTEGRESQCLKKEVKAGEANRHEERCLESSP